MTLEATLEDAQGGALIKNLATAFGVDPGQAQQAVGVMTEALTRRIDRNSLSRGGTADIVDLIAHSNAERILSNPKDLAAAQAEATGNDILNVLIGSKDTSRGIAYRAAKQSGLDETVVKKMLPTVASIVIGSLQQDAPALFAERLKGVQGLRSAGGSPLPLPGDDIPPLQQDRGESLPRRPQAGGSSDGGSPLPVPGDDIPGVGRGGSGGGYDNLPDIIRRGGVEVPGGGDLSTVVRSILGSLLGFQPRGIFGWILDLVLSRWFLGILSRILSRIFSGR